MSIKSNAEVIRDETALGANTATRVGGNLVEIAEDLITKQTAIELNDAKVSFDSTASARLASTTGTNTGDQNLSGLAPINNPTFTGTVAGITKTMVGLSAVPNTNFTDAVALNTLKVGISVAQTNAIAANTTNLLALKITVELDSTLANFFYAPQSLRIASVTNISGTPTIVIRVNTVIYVFGALIAAGALIALTSNVVGVVNLNGNYE